MSSLFYQILLGKLLVLSLVLGYHFSLTLMGFVCCKTYLFIDFYRKAKSWQWMCLPTTASVCIRLAPFQLSPLGLVSSARTYKLVGTQRICSPLVWHSGFKDPHGLEELTLKTKKKKKGKNSNQKIKKNNQKSKKTHTNKKKKKKVGIFQIRYGTHGTHDTNFAQIYYHLWLPPGTV